MLVWVFPAVLHFALGVQELSSIQEACGVREQELLSRIATLEEQLAWQLTSWKDFTSQPIPDGISSVDEMIATIADLKVSAYLNCLHNTLTCHLHGSGLQTLPSGVLIHGCWIGGTGK